MRLRDLEAEFYRREIRPCHIGAPDCNVVSEHTEHEYYVPASFTDADGVMFLCPKCWLANAGPVGTHGIICWRPRVPAGVRPGPGRWEFQGTSLDDLTLVAGSSSVRLDGGCNAHFHVRGGSITDLT